ncbi:MAG: hypothetical protein E7311_00355 [Clostridiales bacterium]|nr:hypothetical protein [Clostridiales bacterium]
MKKIIKTIVLIMILLIFYTNLCFANTKTVKPTESKIFLDSVQMYFETYLIDGYNYFKLRDLAYVFNKNKKAFNVEWNEKLDRIDIITNKNYIPLGNEMQNLNIYKEDKNATYTKSSIYVDNVKKEFETYLIDGYNYFKLRDVLKIIDCGVIYDNITMDININTLNSYIDESYKVPILMYHHFEYDADGTNDMIITPQKFENDILTILNMGYTPISFLDLINYVEDGTKLPNKPIVITMDDGYFSNYAYAFQILKKYNVKACIFPVVKYMEYQAIDYPHFNYLQAKEMINSGLIEVQPHTYDMHVIEKENGPFYNDTLIAIQNLKLYLNTEVYALAYPYGEYTNSTQDTLDKLNIKVSLITDEGINNVYTGSLDSLKCLKRYTISQYTNLEGLLNNIDNIK